jgi:hypothetical protein
MKSDGDVPSEASWTTGVPGEQTGSHQTPGAGVHEPTLSNESPHVVYDPLPSYYSTARQKRALRRAARLKSAPAWVKKIPWLISWPYMLSRRRDPNYEEHYEQWEEKIRNNYDQRDSQ